MKREGRQHAMVKTHRIVPSPWSSKPKTRIINKIDSPLTSGSLTKAPTKPTNHSKFTGKCDMPRCVTCHLQPVSKSKDKIKGTQKLNLGDLVANSKLMTPRIVGRNQRLDFFGFSATGMLDHLASDYMDDEVDDDYENCVYHSTNDTSYEMYNDNTMRDFWSREEGNEVEEVAIRDQDHHHHEDYRDHDRDYDEVDENFMSFYDVGIMLDLIESEGS